MRILGAEVDADLLGCWKRWLAPEIQPFFVASLRSWPRGTTSAGALSPELRDTYKVWRLDPALELLWLDEEAFFAMSRTQRSRLVRSQVGIRRGVVPSVRAWADCLDSAMLRSQADGHRFVWWPSLLRAGSTATLARAVEVEAGSLASRHGEVTAATWNACAEVLPGASGLGGTFASSSGPNCFGTVMAAAGVDTAADEPVPQPSFLAWLGTNCRPGGADDRPGTVLLWRDREGLPVHAAVTLGGGWALEKPSQGWSAPRVVLTTSEIIRANRARGQRLERHHL